jgi:hypothetical protein
MLLLNPLPPPGIGEHACELFRSRTVASYSTLGNGYGASVTTVNGVVAVVFVHVVDFAIEDEPAPGNPLRDAPRYGSEVVGVVLVVEQSRVAEK